MFLYPDPQLNMYGTTMSSSDVEVGSNEQDGDESVASRRGGCSNTLSDKSEPCIWMLTVVGVVGIVVSVIQASTFGMVVAVCMTVLGLLSSWRVRVLGIAHSLMESVSRLHNENNRLSTEVAGLRTIRTSLEIHLHDQEEMVDKLKEVSADYEGMLGILGTNVSGVEEASERLRSLYKMYKEENLKQERNNIVQLFHIIDKDNNGVLTSKEMEQMKKYVRVAYGKDMTQYDTDSNGSVSLEELIMSIK